MKKSIVIVFAGMLSSCVFAQKIKEKDVPAAVKVEFQKLYPTAKEVKWEKEDGNYEVNFDFNKADYSVLMNESGSVLETEVEIELSQLPAGVIEYVKTNYNGQNVKEAAKITDANGVVTYEAEIKGKDLIFDSTGKFIKESKD